MRPLLLAKQALWAFLAVSAVAAAAISPSTSNALERVAPTVATEKVFVLCTVGELGLSKNCRFAYPIGGDRERLKAGSELSFLDAHPFALIGAGTGSDVNVLVNLSVSEASDGKGFEIAVPTSGLQPSLAISDPAWLRSPHDPWTGDFVPDKAARTNQKGLAVVLCIATERGELSDCRILDEEPTGFGFGLGATRVLQDARMKSVSASGVPVAGRPYVQTFRYDGWGATPPTGAFSPHWAPG